MKLINPIRLSLLLILSGMLSFSYQSQASKCQPVIDSCDFYLCKETEEPCGIKGYWLAYGYKFCRMFLNETQEFSEPSKKWMSKVRYCLQNEIKQGTDVLSCQENRRFAMDSHVGCYVETGFCQLSLKDRASIIWMLRSALVLPMTYIEGIELEYLCMVHGENRNYE